MITLRYLGDALLVTPLIASLKQAYPDAEIDVLLHAANAGMLEGNRNINKLILMLAKKSFLSFGRMLCGIFRHYDLAISTQAGDRPILCAILAGKISMGFVNGTSAKQSWKRFMLDRYLEFSDDHSHAVLENLRFCGLLNINPCYVLTPPLTHSNLIVRFPEGKYAVLHIMPQWRYKQWHVEGWLKTANFLSKKGYAYSAHRQFESGRICGSQGFAPKIAAVSA